MKKLKYIGLTACGLALSGCGGGSESEESVPSLFAGAQEVIQTSSNGTVLNTQTYTYLEVARNGTLSLTALPAAQSLQDYYPVELARAIPSKIGSSAQADSNSNALLSAPALSQEAAAAQASAVFQEIWQALQSYYGERLTPAQLLEQIQDLDGDLQTLYEDFIASGLSLAEYIYLYEQIDAYFDGELDEMLLRNFLGQQGLTASQFLQQLHAAGLNANSFFQQIKAKGLTLADLASFYQEHVAGKATQTAPDLHFLNSQNSPEGTPTESVQRLFNAVTMILCTYDSRIDCAMDMRAAISSLWKVPVSAVSKFINTVEGGIVTAITKSFTAISNLFKFAKGTYYAEDFSWQAPVALTGGSQILSNSITREASFAGVTTYKFTVQVQATVGATNANTGNAQWVKSISTSITDKKARAFTAWGVGGFTPITLMQPGTTIEIAGIPVPQDQHVVALAGGMVIKSGKHNHSAVLSTMVGGNAMSLPANQRLVLNQTAK